LLLERLNPLLENVDLLLSFFIHDEPKEEGTS
jgi:hypothetical protein